MQIIIYKPLGLWLTDWFQTVDQVAQLADKAQHLLIGHEKQQKDQRRRRQAGPAVFQLAVGAQGNVQQLGHALLRTLLCRAALF